MSATTWSTPSRKYKLTDKYFCKSELRADELARNHKGTIIHLPWDSRARLENEFNVLRYLQHHTSIPAPRAISLSNDDEALSLTMSREDGIELANVSDDDRRTAIELVTKELETRIIPQLQSLSSTRMGGMNSDELLVLPPRITDQRPRRWSRATALSNEFRLCHTDLGQRNILVHPQTFKIQCIIDWEYAGFYPPFFEAELWKYHPREQITRTQRESEACELYLQRTNQ